VPSTKSPICRLQPMWEGGVGKWFGVQTSSKIFSFIHLWQLQCFGVNIYCHLQLTMAFLPYILQDPVASHGTSVCQVWAAVWMRDGRHSDWSKKKTHKFIIVVTSSNLDSRSEIGAALCQVERVWEMRIGPEREMETEKLVIKWRSLKVLLLWQEKAGCGVLFLQNIW
jgi:hypothetical protein